MSSRTEWRNSGRNGPMVVPVAELLRRPGSYRLLSLRAELEPIANSDAAICGPVDIELRLESNFSGIEATGSITAGWSGLCRRCLAPIEHTATQEVREQFSSANSTDETYRLGEAEVDLAPMVRDCLVLALPIAPLCSPDCVGPAPDSYPMNQPQPNSALVERDPRWAALDALRLS
ncbi:MAG: YceD family protein [bacterium]|nr:YceD family protein [bacterium]